jgi:hypothetical protein
MVVREEIGARAPREGRRGGMWPARGARQGKRWA